MIAVYFIAVFFVVLMTPWFVWVPVIALSLATTALLGSFQ